VELSAAASPPPPALPRLARALDALAEAAGALAALALLGCVALAAALVAARAGLGWGTVASQELVLWLHAIAFLLGMAYALKHDAHVRVDVLRERLAPRTRAIVEIAGVALLLWPLCGFGLAVGWDYVAASWAQSEGSRDGGLPHVWLLKAMVPLALALLALQGLARVLHAWPIARGAAAGPAPEGTR
jgi:TRAP-type mannitol/chloroaromatic compound transport system permease small subunit